MRRVVRGDVGGDELRKHLDVRADADQEQVGDGRQGVHQRRHVCLRQLLQGLHHQPPVAPPVHGRLCCVEETLQREGHLERGLAAPPRLAAEQRGHAVELSDGGGRQRGRRLFRHLQERASDAVRRRVQVLLEGDVLNRLLDVLREIDRHVRARGRAHQKRAQVQPGDLLCRVLETVAEGGLVPLRRLQQAVADLVQHRPAHHPDRVLGLYLQDVEEVPGTARQLVLFHGLLHRQLRGRVRAIVGADHVGDVLPVLRAQPSEVCLYEQLRGRLPFIPPRVRRLQQLPRLQLRGAAQLVQQLLVAVRPGQHLLDVGLAEAVRRVRRQAVQHELHLAVEVHLHPFLWRRAVAGHPLSGPRLCQSPEQRGQLRQQGVRIRDDALDGVAVDEGGPYPRRPRCTHRQAF
mmetsp:Transcript_27581/g.70907  ORF Transcript_27581/g.70907 Transcript_27581/m.70907 type:complete len:404 (+) Transcript_27581:529-1740(+)